MATKTALWRTECTASQAWVWLAAHYLARLDKLASVPAAVARARSICELLADHLPALPQDVWARAERIHAVHREVCVSAHRLSVSGRQRLVSDHGWQAVALAIRSVYMLVAEARYGRFRGNVGAREKHAEKVATAAAENSILQGVFGPEYASNIIPSGPVEPVAVDYRTWLRSVERMPPAPRVSPEVGVPSSPAASSPAASPTTSPATNPATSKASNPAPGKASNLETSPPQRTANPRQGATANDADVQLETRAFDVRSVMPRRGVAAGLKLLLPPGCSEAIPLAQLHTEAIDRLGDAIAFLHDARRHPPSLESLVRALLVWCKMVNALTNNELIDYAKIIALFAIGPA